MTKKLRYLCTLLLCMIASVGWVKAEDTWVKTAATDLKSGDVVIIVDQTSEKAMSNNNGTSSAPTATAIKLNEGKTEITSSVETTLQWVVTVNDDKSFCFGVPGTENLLYCTNTNNGVRVGKSDNVHFSIHESNWLKVDVKTNTGSSKTRYLGVYNSQDWRCYDSTTGNISGTVTAFYKKVENGSSLTPTGLAFEKDAYTVNLNESFTAPTLTNPNNLTVTYASSDENVATVTSDGAVNLVGAGTTTITASSEETETYAAGSASYDLTVIDPNASGQVNNPYTVAQALDADPVNGVYVTGIVSSVVSTSVNNGQIRYYISDDGTENGNKLNVYNGKGLNNEDFTSIEDIQVGDVVVIYGNLSKYQNANQLAAGNYLISRTRKSTPSLSFVEEAYSVVKNGSLTITATSSNSNGEITYQSSNTDIAEIDANTGVVTAKAAGTATITATIAATNEFKSGTATVELTVTAPKHTVTFYQNGTKLSEEEVVEDAAIEFPVPAAELYGKRFVGWTTTVITEPTNTKPTLVTSATMGTADVNYYAVYANQEGENTLSTATLTANDNWSGYSEKTIIDDKGNNWTGVIAGQKSNGVFHYGLTKPDNSKDPHLTSPIFDYDITDVKIVATNGSSKERSFLLKDGESEVGTITVNANTSDVELTASLNDIPFKQFTLTASDALQFKSISVTYGTPATYSDYCTTVKEQATIRLYLPNNPEGNLTEHQLSCGSAVNLNVDTNSPGAITIQDMTDGITVIPNTGNKTVTLLASTNNGKVFSQPGEYTFRVVVGETDSYTSASVDFKLKVVKFRAYFNNLTGFEETKDLANGTNGGQLKDQLFSNTQWGDASYKTWTSTNEDVATIDNDGNITLISTGQVRFTHSYTGNDYNEPCKISTGVMTVIDTTPTVLPTAPTIFHDSGTYEGSVKVSMTAPEGVDIYYTLSTTRNTEGTKYTAPITISETSTLTAWAVQDGVESEKVTREYTIVAKAAGAEVAEGYYTIKNNGNGKYVNVAGRKTVTFVDEAATATAAGTVIKVKAEADGVKVLRSQGVDVPGYADKAMRYVPEIVKLVVDKLNNLGEGQLMGEAGLEALMNKFNDAFDEHLYLETVGENSYRIYGRTPSMQHVVDFYAENKANVDAKLPMLEGKINAAIEKVLEKTKGRGQSILVPFSLETVWQNMGGTLTEPVDEASTMKFYEEVLTSETNVWNFAYETAMIYWTKVEQLINEPNPDSDYADMLENLGDYKKYLEKVPNIRPNFKYFIVQKDNKLDIISEGNGELNADFTAWTLIPRTDFSVAFNEENVLNDKYYTTLYTDFAYTLPEGVKAYKVTEVSKAGVAKKVEMEGTIPAQTPVLLESESKENQKLILSTEDGTAPADNILVGADALINEYHIKTAQVKALFDMAKNILGESFYNTYIQEYEHLMARNAGTVNNKYFFGLTDEDMKLCTYETEDGADCVIRNLGAGENQPLAFYGDWQAPKSNQAFLVSETFNPVLLKLKGDVDRDGDVDEDDLKALVEIVLGKVTVENNQKNYDFDAAHVNEDEDINIADVTALVNILNE